MCAQEKFTSLFYLHSVAVMGASGNASKFGFYCLLSLTKGGFGRKIYPITSRFSQVYGLKVYPSLKFVPNKINSVIVSVPAALAPSILNGMLRKV